MFLSCSFTPSSSALQMEIMVSSRGGTEGKRSFLYYLFSFNHIHHERISRRLHAPFLRYIAGLQQGHFSLQGVCPRCYVRRLSLGRVLEVTHTLISSPPHKRTKQK